MYSHHDSTSDTLKNKWLTTDFFYEGTKPLNLLQPMENESKSVRCTMALMFSLNDLGDFYNLLLCWEIKEKVKRERAESIKPPPLENGRNKSANKQTHKGTIFSWILLTFMLMLSEVFHFPLQNLALWTLCQPQTTKNQRETHFTMYWCYVGGGYCTTISCLFTCSNKIKSPTCVIPSADKKCPLF